MVDIELVIAENFRVIRSPVNDSRLKDEKVVALKEEVAAVRLNLREGVGKNSYLTRTSYEEKNQYAQI